MQDKYGFVYIWYDRKRKMYYIGSHWGTEDDGYICSSNRMRDAHRRRPHDFKRRILSRVYTDRLMLLDEEQKWFDLVKNKDRYYNLHFTVKEGSWWANPDQRLTVGQKISKSKQANGLSQESREKIGSAWRGKKRPEETKAKISKGLTGRPVSEETKAKHSSAQKGRKNKPLSDATKAKLSAINKGKIISDEQRAKISAAKLKTYTFISPTNETVVTNNLMEFCAEHGFNYKNMSKLANGKCEKYRGWTIPSENE